MGHRFTALVGNGLSVPYAPELGVAKLTRGLIDELEQLGGGGTEAGDALAALAGHVRGLAPGDARSNFETLLGPLDATGAAIAELSRISDLTNSASKIKAASEALRDFTTNVHRIGLATVLGHIALQSEARLDDDAFTGTVRSWVDAFRRLPSQEPRTIGSLNYDGLLHAAALDLDLALADLSTGYIAKKHEVVGNRSPVEGYRLRTAGNLPGNEVEILNLHGSLGWLRAEDGTTWKFELSELRKQKYWSAFSNRETKWQPVVILTDRKTRAVGATPFSLAYDVFRSRLVRSNRWMIVGYGFGDEPVNAVLRSAVELMDAESRADLRILIIDHGKDSQEIQEQVVEIAGIKEGQITVNNTGIPAAIECEHWISWSGTEASGQ